MRLKDYKHFFAGTSNVVLPVPNKAHFPEAYQDKSRLHYYASLFKTVEVNSSFYKVPMPRTVGKWAADVPEEFRFTFKLWKGITHVKGLDYMQADVAAFMGAIAPAAERKGCLLIQFPAGLNAVYFTRFQQLLADMEKVPSSQRWPLAVEFRHKSWYTHKVCQLLEKQDVALVVHDMPASATPVTDLDTTNTYLRFHGEHGRYGGSYDEFFLQEYADHINNWLGQGKTVYAYFNNTMGDAVKNLMSLNEM